MQHLAEQLEELRRQRQTLRGRLRYVRVTRPQCPVPTCRSFDLHCYRTMPEQEGTLTRYTQCRACGARFIVVLEPAEDPDQPESVEDVEKLFLDLENPDSRKVG